MRHITIFRNDFINFYLYDLFFRNYFLRKKRLSNFPKCFVAIHIFFVQTAKILIFWFFIKVEHIGFSVRHTLFYVLSLYLLTLSWRRPLLYRNQSIDVQSKSMDWFLYDNGLRHERVKNLFWSLERFLISFDKFFQANNYLFKVNNRNSSVKFV